MNFYLINVRSGSNEPIFDANADYLSVFSRLKSECDMDVKAYCLMPEYLKFIAELKTTRLNHDIQWLDENAQFYFWKKMTQLLPTRQSLRAQCVRIDPVHRLQELTRYIENEPVRAGIVRAAKNYKFCSAYHKPLTPLREGSL